jgi:oxidoreductase family protein
MDDVKSYAEPVKLGSVMAGGTVGEVVESRNANFRIGDTVLGCVGWQQYGLSAGTESQKVDGRSVPLSPYLGVGQRFSKRIDPDTECPQRPFTAVVLARKVQKLTSPRLRNHAPPAAAAKPEKFCAGTDLRGELAHVALLGLLRALAGTGGLLEPTDAVLVVDGGILDPRPGLCVPQDLRYKGKGHELSSLYPSRPEPRLHLLSVVRPEGRYERVGAAEVPCE